jgi:hypothetical protein
MVDFDWPKPDALTHAIIKACEAVPNGVLVNTVPLGELRQFAEALLANHSGVAPSEHGCAAHGLAHPCEACAVESSVEQVLGDFERKERGIPQAHMAADLVRELRAALFAASGVAPVEAPSREDLIALLNEVRQCFTRDDDLPDDLLPRIDAAIDGVVPPEGKSND